MTQTHVNNEDEEKDIARLQDAIETVGVSFRSEQETMVLMDDDNHKEWIVMDERKTMEIKQ